MLTDPQGERSPEVLMRRERAHRILDAAAVLIARWGYNKTNVEDIAKQAGVGKGTIYLHWKTREALFKTLINRERLAMAVDFRRLVSEDPEGATLHGIYKHYASALSQYPLLKAFLLRDPDALGKYAQGEHGTDAFVERLVGFKAHLDFLRQHGLVRTDLSVEQQVYMLSAIVMGFYFVAPMMPAELTPSDGQFADLMADSVARSLESDRVPSADELRQLSENFLAQLDHGLALYQAQLERELGG